jgi:hypothetical protein
LNLNGLKVVWLYRGWYGDSPPPINYCVN